MPQLYLCATRWSSLAFYPYVYHQCYASAFIFVPTRWSSFSILPYVYHQSASPFPYRTTSAVAGDLMISRYSFLLRWYCSPTASPSSFGACQALCFPYYGYGLTNARAASLLYLPPFFLHAWVSFSSDSYKLSSYESLLYCASVSLFLKTLTRSLLYDDRSLCTCI